MVIVEADTTQARFLAHFTNPETARALRALADEVEFLRGEDVKRRQYLSVCLRRLYRLKVRAAAAEIDADDLARALSLYGWDQSPSRPPQVHSVIVRHDEALRLRADA